MALSPGCSKADEAGKRSAKPVQGFLSARGGATCLVKITSGEGMEVSSAQQDGAMQILRTRFSAARYEDVRMAAEGKDHLMVAISGIEEKDIPKAVTIIERAAKLEFRLTEELHVMDTTKEDKAIRPGFVKMRFSGNHGDEEAGTEKWIWVKNKAALSGKCVFKAFHDLDPGAVYYNIQVTLHDEFGTKMLALTTANVGKPLAIILDNEVLWAPRIESPFGARLRISGNFSEQEARDLSIQLTNPLENPLKVEKSTFVPPAAPKKP